MLVLTRMLDEAIVVGDDVLISVVEIRPDRVRLGIAAPANVPVHRQEIYEQMQRETLAAAFAAGMSFGGSSSSSGAGSRSVVGRGALRGRGQPES
jgi:carbon storage regulator